MASREADVRPHSRCGSASSDEDSGHGSSLRDLDQTEGCRVVDVVSPRDAAPRLLRSVPGTTST